MKKNKIIKIEKAHCTLTINKNGFEFSYSGTDIARNVLYGAIINCFKNAGSNKTVNVALSDKLEQVYIERSGPIVNTVPVIEDNKLIGTDTDLMIDIYENQMSLMYFSILPKIGLISAIYEDIMTVVHEIEDFGVKCFKINTVCLPSL